MPAYRISERADQQDDVRDQDELSEFDFTLALGPDDALRPEDVALYRIPGGVVGETGVDKAVKTGESIAHRVADPLPVLFSLRRSERVAELLELGERLAQRPP